MSNSYPKRRLIRLAEYDYTQPGAYFITICAHNGNCLFGEIVDGVLRLSEQGQIVSDEWIKTSCNRVHVKIDSYVVMPNHFHGIVIFDHTGTARRAPTTEKFGLPLTGSLATVIRSFKSAVTRRINALHQCPGSFIWQRGFFEHVERNDDELNRIREYIEYNPLRWSIDRENPALIRHSGKLGT